MEELLQKHRTFTLSVLVGGFVFLVALLVRGCAVYDRDLTATAASQRSRVKDLTADPVPDNAFLGKLEQVVENAAANTEAMAKEFGRNETGEDLWRVAFSEILTVLDRNDPDTVKAYIDQARRLPNAAFTRILEEATTELGSRASQGDVEIGPDNLGFERIDEADFSRNLVALSAIARLVNRSITAGVTRIDGLSVGAAMERVGGTQSEPFLRAQPVYIRLRGRPAALYEVAKSVNERGPAGNRLVLSEVRTLGRPSSVASTEGGVAEFAVQVLLVDINAPDEEAE